MQLDAIGIVSSDLKESVRFYSFLGLSFPTPKDDDQHLEATTKSGLRLMLDSEKLMKQLKPHWVSPVGQRMTLAFLCANPQEVDQAYTKIIEAGFASETAPWDAFWGQRYATVRDPDGNAVDIFAPL